MAVCTTLPLDAEALRHLAAALGTYWEQPVEVRAALVAGLPALIDDLNRGIDDGYRGRASAEDSPASLLRQFDHALRRRLATEGGAATW